MNVLIWGGEVVGRDVRYREPLNDGTPRTTTGYRPYVETIGPDTGHGGRPMRRIFRGPVFQSEAEADGWVPPAPEQKE